MRKRFDEQEAKKIADMYMSGMTMADIQRFYGLSSYGSIVTALESQGVKRRDKTAVLRRFTPDEETVICDMYRSGTGSSSISEKYYGDRSGTQTILGVLTRNGVKLRGRGGACEKCGLDNRNQRGRCVTCARRVSREWYLENRDRALELGSRWYYNNKERVYAIKHKRRAMIEGNGGLYTEDEWQELLERYNHTCLGCGRNDVQMTKDHIIPVTKGGSSDIDNIQPLCDSCNKSKGTKSVDYRKGPHAKENVGANGGESD